MYADAIVSANRIGWVTSRGFEALLACGAILCPEELPNGLQIPEISIHSVYLCLGRFENHRQLREISLTEDRSHPLKPDVI